MKVQIFGDASAAQIVRTIVDSARERQITTAEHVSVYADLMRDIAREVCVMAIPTTPRHRLISRPELGETPAQYAERAVADLNWIEISTTILCLRMIEPERDALYAWCARHGYETINDGIRAMLLAKGAIVETPPVYP